MHGILVIDKPGGITSHDVVRRVRRLLGTRRVGHTGTLDPMATGVLPVAVGEGTRLVQFLVEGDKTYRGILRLGLTTDTQDIEGRILRQRPSSGIDAEEVRQAAAALTGDLDQLPPMYSAIKKNGVPLYRLARQGVDVERESRRVTVYRLELVRIDLPEVEFTVSCSKGTFVRTLAHDLGERLGCGAVLTALRRTRSGPFREQDCRDLESLGEEAAGPPRLLGPREVLPEYPVIEVGSEAGRRLRDGIPPGADECSGAAHCREGDRVLLSLAGRVQAVARYEPRRAVEKRGDFVLLRVFSRPDIW